MHFPNIFKNEEKFDVHLEIIRDANNNSDWLSRYVQDKDTKVFQVLANIKYRKFFITAKQEKTISLLSTAEGKTGLLLPLRKFVGIGIQISGSSTRN